jgi:tetratricopeptide (TPR) repeat protein
MMFKGGQQSGHRRTRLVAVWFVAASCVLLAGQIAFAQADVPPDPTISLDSQFRQICALYRATGDADNVMAKLKAFADEHPDHDLAAEAHLKIADLLLRKGDIKAAIEKTKWVGDRFPKAKIRQSTNRGWLPSSMVAEWREYVEKHPILIKDAVWYRLGNLYRTAGNYEAALEAYDHVLATVRPDEIPPPDTKNEAIVITFRLHKNSLEQKIELLADLTRTGKMKDADVKRVSAEAEYEKLYPKALWQRLELQACDAFQSYVERDRKTTSQPDNSVHE